MTADRGTLAIDGGTPLRDAPWPDAPVVEPVRADAPVEALERAIAERLELEAASVVAVAQADEAYRLALTLAPPAEGAEAVIPCLLEDAAAEAARSTGWTVVPGEVESDTGALSVRGLSRAVGEQTRIAVVGHAFGHPAVMNELAFLADDRQVTLVEDLSGALGASFRGTPVGRLGALAVLAGRPGDPISQGAYLIAPDGAAAAAARARRTAPPPEDAARLALAQVRALDEELTHRRHLAWELTFGLRGMRGVTAMPHGRWVHHAYPRYVIRLRSLVWKRSLDETIATLRAEGVPCERACGPPLHTLPWVQAALPDDARVADDVFSAAGRLPGELISLPLHSGLTSKDMDQVTAALRKVEAKST